MAKDDVACIFTCVRTLSCSCRVRLFVTPWTAWTPLSMGFSRQEYWSGLPCLPSGHLSDPGIEPVSLAFQVDYLSLSHWGSHIYVCISIYVHIYVHTYTCIGGYIWYVYTMEY